MLQEQHPISSLVCSKQLRWCLFCTPYKRVKVVYTKPHKRPATTTAAGQALDEQRRLSINMSAMHAISMTLAYAAANAGLCTCRLTHMTMLELR
jgi:hypothetical protein